MRLKPTFFIFAFIFIGFLNGFSQEKLSGSEQKTFKEAVLKTAQATNSIKSDFTQTKHLSILDNDIISEGVLVFKAPNSVKWAYTKPYKNTAIFKNNQLLINNEGKKEEMDLSSNRLFRSLNTLIVNSIKGDMFDETQFEISYLNHPNGYLVSFIPKDKRLKKFISAFELKFDGKSYQVTEVKLLEPNEDYTLIVFKNKQINPSVSDALFNN